MPNVACFGQLKPNTAKKAWIRFSVYFYTKRNERMDQHTVGDSLINCVGNTNQNKIDDVHKSHQKLKIYL